MSEPKRRESPQPEALGRAALCAECWYLLDSAGHRWGHELASLRPPPVSGRVLQAIAGLGGEASVTEIRKALGDSAGGPPEAKHVKAGQQAGRPARQPRTGHPPGTPLPRARTTAQPLGPDTAAAL